MIYFVVFHVQGGYFWGCFVDITALYGINILVVTDDEDTIDHSEISYSMLNFVVYVCPY